MVKEAAESKKTTKQTKVSDKKVDLAETQDEKIVSTEKPAVEEPKSLAKAGKRSPKAVKTEEEKKAKVARKTAATPEEPAPKPKSKAKPTRSRLERRGKKFRNVAKQLEPGKVYSLSEALGLVTKTSPSKFDATVELHVRLSVDPRQADQNLRDTLVLPAGSGKFVRVAVFCSEEDSAAAKKAGADIAGIAEVVQRLDKNQFDFDILIAEPALMAQLAKYARILGPRSLMPNPKSGTVTSDIAKAVKESKSGRVEYRVDSTGIVHLGFGKVSFGEEKLGQNLAVVFSSLKANKPSSIKGAFIKTIYLSTTMGPSLAVDPASLS